MSILDWFRRKPESEPEPYIRGSLTHEVEQYLVNNYPDIGQLPPHALREVSEDVGCSYSWARIVAKRLGYTASDTGGKVGRSGRPPMGF